MRVSQSAAVAAILLAAVTPVLRGEDRSYDGTGNNLGSFTLGSAGTDYIREASGAHYGDGISSPGGANLPSARAISDALFTQGETSVPDPNGLTAMVYTWGQFIDHDLDLEADTSPPISIDIPVPSTDITFDPAGTGTQTIPVTRSAWNPATGTNTANPAQQINTITSYLDASMVYGSNATRAAWLRTGAGGLLKATSTPTGALLPHDDGTQVMDGIMGPTTSSAQFVTGDSRANEQIGITSIQTLLMREHNRQATLLARANPTWTDDQIYQRARKIVSAEIDSITYNQFLPAMLGSGAVPAYGGYNATVNPSISNAFAAVGFRLGHSMLDNDIERVGPNGQTIAQGNLALRDAFFNPSVLTAPGTGGVDDVLRGFTTRVEQAVDPLITDDVRNFLFGAPGQGGMDLGAIDIERGRDHGLADYNTMRQDFGLSKVTTFAQISSDPNIQAQLQALYGNVNNIDAFVGALSEDHVAGASVGPLVKAMLVDQFKRSRDGDRLFYLNDPAFTAGQVSTINSFTLSDLIHRNTFIRDIQDNAFVAGNADAGPTWNVATGASWAGGGNWTNPSGAPTGSGVFANFTTNTASALNVTLDAPTVIGSVVLSNSAGVNISAGGGGSLSFDNAGSSAGLLISAGSHSITAPMNLTDSLSVIYWGAGSVNLSGNIGESNVGRSITVDGSGAGLTGGGITTLGGNNSFTGGVQVTQSLLNLNTATAQGAIGSTAGASDNGEIVLGFTPSASHRFVVQDLGAIDGTNAQLGALSIGGNLSMALGAMIVRQSAGGSLPANLGTTPLYYNGYTTNVTGASAVITIGATSGTVFRGIGSDRVSSYTWGASSDSLTLAGNADFVALGGSTLTVAAKVTGGIAGDTIDKRGTGTVKLTNSANNFAASNINVQSGILQYSYGQPLVFPATMTFAINPNATLKFQDNFNTTLNAAVVNNGSIVKPAGLTTQLIFSGAALTGTGSLLAQDPQTFTSNPYTPTSTVLAHAILFNNGKTNFVGGVGGLNPTMDSPIIALDGPNTSVHLTGKWQGDGSSQNSWLMVNNGAHFYIDAGATLDTIGDVVTQLRGFRGRGDGTGTVDFADGFVANQSDDVPGVTEFYVWSPGNFNWITRNSLNFPDSNIEVNQEDGGRWIVATHDQVAQCGFTTSRSLTIETQSNLTLAKPASWVVFDGTKTITKTGSGTMTIAGENAVGSGPGMRTQSTLGSTLNVTGGHFVEMTDMGQCALNAGTNGLFGSAGHPDGDDVITTKYLWNYSVSNAGSTAEFDSSQHLLSLKINSGATANLNPWAYGNNAATTLTAQTLGTDSGSGTINVAPGNLATASTLFSVAAASTFNKIGGGTLAITGSLTFASNAAININNGTFAIAMPTGSVATIGSASPSISIANGATLTVNALNNDPFSDDSVSTNRASLTNNGVASFTSGSVSLATLDGTSGVLHESNGVQLTADHVRQNTLDLLGSATASVRAGGGSSALSTVNTLSIAGGNSPTAKLDLADNAMVIDYTGFSPIGLLRNQVIAGRASGAWTGKGITSSTAAAVAIDSTNTHKTGIGITEASAINMQTFDGQPIDSTSIIARYTYLGDANLDGLVNALDFNALATNYGLSGKAWSDGDFNYDGKVDSNDFGWIAANFASALPADIPEDSSPAVRAQVLVPEPVVLSILGAVMLPLRRRNRQSKQNHIPPRT